MREHGTLHVPDVTRSRTIFQGWVQPAAGAPSWPLPFVSRGIHWTLNARRIEVRPFTPAQIKLLETFADQAVIAIENVRLFKELKGVVGAADGDERDPGVIASSPTDIQPVLDVVAENAARLCDATDAAIIRVEGESLKAVANYGSLSSRF